MDDPWFRRNRFTYSPLTWQGRVVLAVMAFVCLPLGVLFVIFVESRPVLGVTAGVLAVFLALACHSIIVWKMEGDFRRR